VLRRRWGWEEWSLLIYHIYEVAEKVPIHSYSWRCLMRANLETVLGRVMRSRCWLFGAALLLLWVGRFAPPRPSVGEATAYCS
jgi:hypothetical protein